MPGCSLERLSETHIIGRGTQEWLISSHHAPAFQEYGIFLAGWSEAREGFCFIRPHFPMSQVLACTGGAGEVFLDGTWHRCEAGQVYLTPAEVFHAYRALKGEVWEVSWVTYHSDVVPGKRPVLRQADTTLFAFLLRQLYQEVTGQAEADTLQSWVQLLQTHAQRLIHTGDDAEPLTRLWDEVKSRLSHPWTLEEMTALSGVSREQLRRLCQQELGCSPMQHVTHLRMEYAVSLLVSHRYTLEEVAHRVGYSNPFVFSNAFKRVLGIRPSCYVAQKLLPAPE
ncbi:MAG: AraC family transcriptional regulator [Armatimonas sp.]